MEYLIRFAQAYETFRRSEIESLAILTGADIEFKFYSDSSPFCVVILKTDEVAKTILQRSILAHDIYELWGTGHDLQSLHISIQGNERIDTEKYRNASFRFDVDSFQGKRDPTMQRNIIDSFNYLPLHGPVQMIQPDIQLCVFEEYESPAADVPQKLHFGRWIARGGRASRLKYDLKKRRYISRTSMDAELSLITANMALAAPGKVMFDPFVGTGSFSVACAHFGATVLGSDIDGRSIRGTDDRNLCSNFDQYGLTHHFMDSFISDLTNTPIRPAPLFDCIICDPPYGVREGPKVLGHRDRREVGIVIIDGVPAHLRDGYVPPKRPYGFDDMLADILEFAVLMLVPEGRLCMWMPTADDEDIELNIPTHPALELISSSVQHFNKWSRRLLTYRRLPENLISHDTVVPGRKRATGYTADDLNRFRRRYFGGFKEER